MFIIDFQGIFQLSKIFMAGDPSTEYAQKDYPGMRKITGDYMVREITLK